MILLKYILWRFDLMVYRLFYWRWSKRIAKSPELSAFFVEWTKRYAQSHPPLAAHIQIKINKMLDDYEVKFQS